MGKELAPKIKYLKKSELKEGKFYTCRLSGKEVLIKKIIYMDDGVLVLSKRFNEIEGCYVEDELGNNISDYQLY